ncbi:hypothetical protein [Jeotgalibacillus campisalis]|uniref:Transporter n=1 Tax=Jeotgalibacillus campisalis TaxID=220754 RepID=A0A0C2VVK8_9BACL|nr:hypothetical protein [Jeotgalibacillus campisalis]KIL52942.1 hypothetical protein KR50_02710 [Jeotgalibacillus campisalis]
MNEYYYMNSYPYYDQEPAYDQRILSPISWFPLPGSGQGGGQGFPFPGGGQSGGQGFPFPGGGQSGGQGFPFPGGNQGGGQGFPFPNGGQGGNPFPGGGQGGGSSQQSMSAPTSPPPSQIPPKPFTAQGGPSVFLVDPNVIRPCLFRFTYVWLTSGASFWFYPVVLGSNSVGGFYWNSSRFRWMYIGLDTRNIEVVSCS